jgi:hypothetical protein
MSVGDVMGIYADINPDCRVVQCRPRFSQGHIFAPLDVFCKGRFPLGGILRSKRNFSLSFLISSTREITRQRKIPLRA